MNDNNSEVNEWGISCSPLVLDNMVVVSAGGRLKMPSAGAIKSYNCILIGSRMFASKTANLLSKLIATIRIFREHSDNSAPEKSALTTVATGATQRSRFELNCQLE